MKIIKGLVAIGGLFIMVMIAAAFIGLGSAASHDQKTSDRVAANWAGVYVGESKADVRAALGKPDDVTTSTSSNFEGGTTRYDSWTYGTLASTSYSVDFIDGTVESKTTI